MSVGSVRAVIRQAMLFNAGYEKSLTRYEASRVVAEARKGGVTRGEVNVVRDLMSKGVDPSRIFTEAIPELRGDAFYMMPNAKRVLQGFINANTPSNPGRFVTLAIPENPNDPVPSF